MAAIWFSVQASRLFASSANSAFFLSISAGVRSGRLESCVPLCQDCIQLLLYVGRKRLLTNAMTLALGLVVPSPLGRDLLVVTRHA